MRDILFRGKNEKFGNWEYGGIVHQTDFYGDEVDRYYIIDGTTTQDYDIGYECKVVKNTIGQFVGFVDMNGSQIFEGDILENRIKHLNRAIGERVLLTDIRHSRFLATFAKNYIIIGNVHDNQDLLNSAVEIL